MNRQNETKFCIHIIIDKNFVGIVNRCFLQICNRVMTLDSRQSLDFTQYLENEDRMRRNFVYTLSLTRSTLALKIIVFHKFATELQPLIHVRIWILLNILRTN